jgi:TolB protein
VSVVDLTTGKTVDTFSVGQTASLSFTRPDGLAVLSSATTGSTSTLARYSLGGDLQLTYPTAFSQVGTFEGTFLLSPDGTRLLMAARTGIAVVSNSGTVLSQIPVPGTTDCRLTRWWAPTVALGSCISTTGADRLWEIPTSGAAPTALTAKPVPPDAGDLNAWQTPSGVYLQDAGGCGSVYLAKLQADSTTSPVTVPNVNSADSVDVLGTNGGLIGLQATFSCGPGISALWFDPVADTTTVVLGPPVNGGSVTGAILYPEPNG